jgi:hypothetical protein
MKPEQIETYRTIAAAAGVLATLGLFSVLYKENKFYRLFEHIFLGLAAGWSAVAVWTESLREIWWDKLTGVVETTGVVTEPGRWAYILLIPIGAMGYMVFSKKHNWMAKIPMGVLLGIWSGQQIQSYWTVYGPQMKQGMLPIVPTAFDQVIARSDRTPELAAVTITWSQAISNFLFVFTLLSVLSYFLFSFEVKNKALKQVNVAGRYLLMIGFGAIFGSTVMMRFSLVIDRMYFIWDEFLMKRVLHIG